MASNAAETMIGAAVLAVAGGFLVYAAQTADIGGIGGQGGYEIYAPFRKAEGLTVGADVRISGVKVGTVAALTLDRDTYRARARLVIDEDYQVPEDSVVTIASEGLLGGAFVAIDPGASDFMLESGAEVEHTQGSVNLFELIGKAIAD